MVYYQAHHKEVGGIYMAHTHTHIAHAHIDIQTSIGIIHSFACRIIVIENNNIFEIIAQKAKLPNNCVVVCHKLLFSKNDAL